MYGKSVKVGSFTHRTYRILKTLASGSSGAVYMAWHTRLRKHVVIKVVNECDTRSIEINRNEVEALKNIRNLYIPQVYDFIIENGYSFTVIEYIEGESFDNLLKSGRKFTEAQIIKWYSQLASALSTIHNQDICHRDIKPANVILTVNGDICLIDFGSAFVNSNNTGLISRSMGYASPEQYEFFKLCKGSSADNSKAFSDNIETVLLVNDCITEMGVEKNYARGNEKSAINWKLSDIYSLGATMYHLLTGNRPLVRVEEMEKSFKLQEYSKELLKIIEKSMKTTPSKRYTSAEELVKTLFSLHSLDSV
jgi:serine/threonine protein kinase